MKRWIPWLVRKIRTLPQMLQNGSTEKNSPTAGKILFLFAYCELSVWWRWSSALQRRQQQAVFQKSSETGLYALCIYYTKASSLALAESGLSMWNRSITIAKNNLLCTCKVGGSRSKFFLTIFLALNYTILEIRRRCFAYVEGTLNQWSCLFLFPRSATRPPVMYSDLTNFNWLSYRGCAQAYRNTYYLYDWWMFTW